MSDARDHNKSVGEDILDSQDEPDVNVDEDEDLEPAPTSRSNATVPNPPSGILRKPLRLPGMKPIKDPR